MRNLREWVADIAGVPKDVIMGLPRVSICGDKEIFIEEHRGLARYTDGEIDVRMRDGIMRVKGRGLRIIVLEESRMVINGDFSGVEYDKTEKNGRF